MNVQRGMERVEEQGERYPFFLTLSCSWEGVFLFEDERMNRFCQTYYP